MTFPDSAEREAATVPLGSDFAAPADDILLSESVSPPWERGDALTSYVQTGRGGLRQVARVLSQRGYHTILVPSFLCDSMLAPFVEGRWRIVPVTMTVDLSLDPDHLVTAAAGIQDPITLYFVEYFGRLPSAELWAAVDHIRRERGDGLVVVGDETHSVFQPWRADADVAIGSLRKTLPLADGAFIRSRSEEFVVQPKLTGDAGQPRWLAMDKKTHGGVSSLIREDFLAANESLEASVGTDAPTGRSLELIPRLNYSILADRRVKNTRALAESLGSAVSLLNSAGEGEVPSHLVIRVPRPQELQRYLASQNIFCAIHWPESHVLPTTNGWPHDLLSLPIDHRYNTEDMDRIAHHVLTWVQRARAR